MSVAETFSHSDTHTILGGAQDPAHHAINARGFLDAQLKSTAPAYAANESHAHGDYQPGIVGRRRARRDRRALRA